MSGTIKLKQQNCANMMLMIIFLTPETGPRAQERQNLLIAAKIGLISKARTAAVACRLHA
jgi:hypothetical protein